MVIWDLRFAILDLEFAKFVSMHFPKLRLEAGIETHPQPLFLEGRVEVPSKKRGLRGVYTVFQKTKLSQKLQLLRRVLIFLKTGR
jgi:hypothetical protein